MTLKTLNLQTLFLFLILAFAGFSQENLNSGDKPIYNSLLWEISGNDLSEASYLYGTMHVSQKLAFHLGDPFFKAIESCSMVALELNPETWMKDLAETDLAQDPYSAQSTYNDFYVDAFKMPVPKNRDIAYHIAADDNLINGLLYRSNNFDVDFEEETYLDLYIFQTGRRMGKEVFSLEDYQEVMDFSKKAMVPDEDAEKYNYRKLNELFKETSPQEVLQDSYRKGDLNLVDSVSKLMNPSKNFHKYMIVERNIGMANNMDSIMQAGTSLFTGVGAAHLPGSYGVIELLREKGYTVNPIEKGVGGKSKTYQAKYDDLLVPFDYKKQEFEEEFYSVDAPGTMYPMPSFGNFVTYLHPNMTNGAYFWVKRIKTYDPLLSRNEDYTLQRIDSMLYENIPGEIVSKKQITNNDVKGFDIVNKTRQGDIQRYNIFITPLEILIFKMGGSKDFTLDHGAQFFSSIDIDLPLEKKKMVGVSPDEGGFRVKLPAYHLLYRLRNGMSSGGPGIEYQGVDKKGDFYMVRKTVLNDPTYIEEDQFELDQFVETFIEQDAYDSLWTKDIIFNDYPAKDASYSVINTSKKLHTRTVIKGAEYFSLSKLTDDSFESCNEFFDSFKFDKFVYAEDFEELVDSSMSFKTNTVKMSKNAVLMREMQLLYYENTTKEEDDFNYMSKNRNINASDTGEEIAVKMERFNAFTYEINVDSLWSSVTSAIDKDYGMVVSRMKQSRQDSLYILDMFLVDTGSTRAVKVKKILSNRRMYTLETTVNTLDDPSEFVNVTYGSFSLFPDSTKQQSVFTKKNDLFFTLLESGDSLKISRAFEFADMIQLDKSDEKQLLKHIKHFNFPDHGISERASLIKLLAQLKSKSSLAFLENEYLANEDTVTYQLACLSALSSMKTLESRKILVELLVNSPTIPSESSEMSEIYRPLFDSLAISKVLFPEIMELSTFPEYKNNNLNLLSALVRDDQLKPRVLKKYKRQLINEGLIELKRQFASEEGGDDRKNLNWNIRNKMTRLNYNLLDYATIMAPWYKDEEKVQKFFKDVQRLKNKRTLTRLVCIMELNHVHVSDETLRKLASENNSRAFFLDNLRYYDLEHIFDSDFMNPDTMAFSLLVSEYEFENDTTDIQFIGKHLIASKEHPGYYYFYKAKRKGYYEDEASWAIYYNGPQPSNGEGVNSTAIVNEKSENIDADEDYQDLLDKIILKLQKKGRKRYGTQYDDYGY